MLTMGFAVSDEVLSVLLKPRGFHNNGFLHTLVQEFLVLILFLLNCNNADHKPEWYNQLFVPVWQWSVSNACSHEISLKHYFHVWPYQRLKLSEFKKKIKGNKNQTKTLRMNDFDSINKHKLGLKNSKLDS